MKKETKRKMVKTTVYVTHRFDVRHTTARELKRAITDLKIDPSDECFAAGDFGSYSSKRVGNGKLVTQ